MEQGGGGLFIIIAGHDPASAKSKDPVSVIALNRAEWHGTTTRMCVCVYICKNTIF